MNKTYIISFMIIILYSLSCFAQSIEWVEQEIQKTSDTFSKEDYRFIYIQFDKDNGVLKYRPDDLKVLNCIIDKKRHRKKHIKRGIANYQIIKDNLYGIAPGSYDYFPSDKCQVTEFNQLHCGGS